MLYSIDEIRKRVTPVARKYNLPRVYLFGSYARGEATEGSDVDILIDRAGSAIHGRGLFGMAAVYNDLRESLGKELDLVTVAALDQDNDSRSARRFSETVRKERISLYEQQFPVGVACKPPAQPAHKA